MNSGQSGLVLQPTSPTSAPDRSCSSVVLHVKASFVKHESSIPSAWTVGLQCPAKAIVALHGERVPEAEVSLFLIDSWLYLKDPEQHSWWPRAPVAKAWRHAGLPTPLILFEGGLTLLHVCAILMKIRNLLVDTVISHVTLGYNFNDLIRRKGKRQSGRQMVRSAWVFDALLQTWDIAFSLSLQPCVLDLLRPTTLSRI